MDHRPRPPSFGPKTPVICSSMAKLKLWSQPSLLCLPLLRHQVKARVSPSKLLATLPPTPPACGIRHFERRGCMWAVASLKRLVKPLSLLVSSALACAGPLGAWMRFCLCVLLFSTRPTMLSGRTNLVWLLNHPQLIHTHNCGPKSSTQFSGKIGFSSMNYLVFTLKLRRYVSTRQRGVPALRYEK